MMYTIIFQGLLSESVLQNIIGAKKYSDDVILSTWKNQNDKKLLKILINNNIKIIELDDPGTIISFKQRGNNFYFNIKRHLYGISEAAKISKHEFIIKCRCDLYLDFNKFFKIYKASNRKIGALNWVSVNPNKFLSLPYFYHISDWCYVISREKIITVLGNIKDLSEAKYKINSIQIGNIKWFIGLAPEQLMTLILSNKIDYMKPNHMLFNNNNYLDFKKQCHKECLKNFVNISRDAVKAKSTKYNGALLRWIMYKDEFFNDKYFSIDIHNLFLYMLKLILKK